ncbi:helix-turn-helix domain-containing protein [Spirosoma linguale]|uniref:Transcriptional regulator, XRE family n=1 Tax=Spirosoma linguale (strain ATCC 33905 / DSM 74 / LMG 10896 / Claus 1) TaxID=504472 RepID=D2QK77_SPILD|nr:transcriptional regulator, XRE family [Spirosoma linguale DSM 74]
MPFNYTKLRRLRELFGYSQAAVAFTLNVAQSTYYRLEAGKSKLDPDQLKAVARLYGITVEELLEYESSQLVQLVLSRDSLVKLRNDT